MFVKENSNTLTELFADLVNANLANTPVNRICSHSQSLMNEFVIKCDLLLIISFHSYFMFYNFKYLQSGDREWGQTPGFLSWHTLPRHCAMHNELSLLQSNKWQHCLNFFECYMNVLNLLFKEKELQVKKTNVFI